VKLPKVRFITAFCFCLAVACSVATSAQYIPIYGSGGDIGGGGGDIGGGGGDIGGGGGDIGGGGNETGGGIEGDASTVARYAQFLRELMNVNVLAPNDGSGRSIAIIDSGVSPDFRGLSNVKEFIDYTGEGCRLERPCDGHSHGNAMADIIHQVAPGADLLVLRVLNKDLRGTQDSVLAALRWVIDHQRDKNIRVVNMSLQVREFGSSHAGDEMRNLIAKATQNGILVVVAAGNYGQSNIQTLPANSEEAITVGSMSHNFTLKPNLHFISEFSNLGVASVWKTESARANSGTRATNNHVLVIKPDIFAPGESTLAQIERGTVAHQRAGLLQRIADSSDEVEVRRLGNQVSLVPGALDDNWALKMLTLLKALGEARTLAEIKTIFTGRYKYFLIDDQFTFLKSTSAAAAALSGGLAVLDQAIPNVDPVILKQKMMETASDLNLDMYAARADYSGLRGQKPIGVVNFGELYRALLNDVNSPRKHQGESRKGFQRANP